MELSERRRLTQALGWGAGAHLLLLLLLVIIPMESRQEKIPLGAIRVELGPGTDSRAGEKAGAAPVVSSQPQRSQPPAARPGNPTPPVPASRPASSQAAAPQTAKPSPAPAPAVSSPRPAETPSPAQPSTAAPSSPPAEIKKPSPPAPVDAGLRSSSAVAETPGAEMEGLDLLAGLSDLGGPSSGLSKADGQTKFEAGAGNPVELEAGVINARPLPLVPPVAPTGTPPGELEVRFVIGASGLIKITPESLVMRGLSGNIATTPVTSEEWIRLRSAVEKALRSWIFTTDGREIRGRVVFTIKSR